MAISGVKVTIIPGSIARLQQQDIVPWLFNDILLPAVRFARREANVDTGFMRAGISAEIETGSGKVIGWVYATAAYALWQETIPGDVIPGVGTRQRSGGKPYLRPGVLKALQPYIGR